MPFTELDKCGRATKWGRNQEFQYQCIGGNATKWVCLCVCDIFLEINMKKYGKGKERIGKRIGTE